MDDRRILAESMHSKTVVEQIVDRIVLAIIEGEVKPGEKLPTEMELSNSLGVGRNSIREAVKILEALGVVNIRRAEGTFVSDRYNSNMLNPMVYGIILQKNTQLQLVQMRKVLEIGVFTLAMEKITQADITHLQSALAKMNHAVKAPEISAELIFDLDVEFHKMIIEIMENDMLSGICDYVDKITRPSRVQTISRIIEDGKTEAFIELHRSIISTLREKHADRIENVITEHYQYWNYIG